MTCSAYATCSFPRVAVECAELGCEPEPAGCFRHADRRGCDWCQKPLCAEHAGRARCDRCVENLARFGRIRRDDPRQHPLDICADCARSVGCAGCGFVFCRFHDLCAFRACPSCGAPYCDDCSTGGTRCDRCVEK